MQKTLYLHYNAKYMYYTKISTPFSYVLQWMRYTLDHQQWHKPNGDKLPQPAFPVTRWRPGQERAASGKDVGAPRRWIKEGVLVPTFRL